VSISEIFMVTGLNQGGVTEVATPDEQKENRVNPEQAAELALWR
jgi:hypothetical protein